MLNNSTDPFLPKFPRDVVSNTSQSSKFCISLACDINCMGFCAFMYLLMPARMRLSEDTGKGEPSFFRVSATNSDIHLFNSVVMPLTESDSQARD